MNFISYKKFKSYCRFIKRRKLFSTPAQCFFGFWNREFWKPYQESWHSEIFGKKFQFDFGRFFKVFEVELLRRVTSGTWSGGNIARCIRCEAKLNITDLNKNRVKSWKIPVKNICKQKCLTKATVSSTAAKVNELNENSTVSTLSIPVPTSIEASMRSETQVFV